MIISVDTGNRKRMERKHGKEYGEFQALGGRPLYSGTADRGDSYEYLYFL